MTLLSVSLFGRRSLLDEPLVIALVTPPDAGLSSSALRTPVAFVSAARRQGLHGTVA